MAKLKALHFSYEPLEINSKGTIDEAMHLQYLRQSVWPGQLELMVLGPLTQAFKKAGEGSYPIGEKAITVSQRSGPSTKWAEVYGKLRTFLDIRSDDKDVIKKKELKLVDGFGYCISTKRLLSEITNGAKEFTSNSSSYTVTWPRAKKSEESLHDLVVDLGINYSKINPDSLLAGLGVKRFIDGLKKGVLDVYEDANKAWFEKETSYHKDNLPPKDISPIRAARDAGNQNYIIVTLSREDKSDYKKIISTLEAELKAIESGERGELWRLYRPADDGFVNLGKVTARLDTLYNQHLSSNARYTFAP